MRRCALGIGGINNRASKMVKVFSQWELFVQLQMAAYYRDRHLQEPFTQIRTSFNYKWLPTMEAAIFEAPICKTLQYLIFLRVASLNVALVHAFHNSTYFYDLEIFSYQRPSHLQVLDKPHLVSCPVLHLVPFDPLNTPKVRLLRYSTHKSERCPL